VELWARSGREILPEVATSTSLFGSFTCRKARHGTDGFTSPPKEGVLIQCALVKKILFTWTVSVISLKGPLRHPVHATFVLVLRPFKYKKLLSL
jgi:hypothetical protein